MIVVTVSWAVVSWAVVSWAVVSWAVLSSCAFVGECNTPCLPVGANSVVVVSARVYRRLHLLRQVLMVRCCAPSFLDCLPFSHG